MPSHASSGYCALRAPTVFSVRIKSASVQKTRLWIKARAVRGGFYTRSSIVHGCAFHPCAIDDPRGRFLVRATPATLQQRGRDCSRHAVSYTHLRAHETGRNLV